MNAKDELLQTIRNGLANHVITAEDLRAFVAPEPVAINIELQPTAAAEPAANPKKLNIIDILFYIAGLILYAALMVMAFQLGKDVWIMRIIITLGVGLLIWGVVYILGTQSTPSDMQRGLVNSLMITGSLAVISGGIITANQVAGSTFSEAGLAMAVAVALIILGAAHLVFDRLFRHIILVSLGVLLLSAAFPTVFVALLSNQEVPVDVWTLIGIASGCLVWYGGILASETLPERAFLKDSFESFAAFIALGSIYYASLTSSVAALWEVVLPLAIYGAFFASIKRRSKNFLVTGALFLVLYLITISFKYFSGLGVAFCLILSGLSILATAFMAVNINKKYIKLSRPQVTN